MNNEMTRSDARDEPQGEPRESTRGVPVYRPLADIRDFGSGVVLMLECPASGRTGWTSTSSAAC